DTGVVPAVDKVERRGRFRIPRVLRAGSEMEVRDCVVEEHAARVVPVAVGLDDFVADRSDEFPDRQSKTLTYWSQIGRVGFLDVELIAAAKDIRSVYRSRCLAVTGGKMIAEAAVR